MKFASPEIREKAVRAYIDGKASAKRLAEIFGYTRATICNWVRAYKKTKQLAAKPNGHRKSCFSEEELVQLKALVAATPDITLAEIKAHFNKSCCLAAICRHLAKLGYAYKKTLKASEQDREDVKKKREDWQNFQRNSDPARLVFLDETGA